MWHGLAYIRNAIILAITLDHKVDIFVAASRQVDQDLGAFLFRNDDVDKKVKVDVGLDGGLDARIDALAQESNEGWNIE